MNNAQAEKKPVVLKSRVVSQSGSDKYTPKCPVCGNKETTGALCINCRRELGWSDSSGRVKASLAEVESCYEKAVKGHKVALAADPDVPRDIIMPAVLAMIDIPEDPKEAKMMFPKVPGVKPYMTVKIPIEGGFLELHIFGAFKNMRGKTVCAWVEGKEKLLKNKLKKGGERQLCCYLRAQVMPEASSDVKLAINDSPCLVSLPYEGWEWSVGVHELYCTVGFQSISHPPDED